MRRIKNDDNELRWMARVRELTVQLSKTERRERDTIVMLRRAKEENAHLIGVALDAEAARDAAQAELATVLDERDALLVELGRPVPPRGR